MVRLQSKGTDQIPLGLNKTHHNGSVTSWQKKMLIGTLNHKKKACHKILDRSEINK